MTKRGDYRLHWFEMRWIYERVVIDGETVVNVARDFGVCHTSIGNAIRRLGGVSVARARINYVKQRYAE